MKNLGKILALTMILVITLSMFTVAFASGDLNDWKDGATAEDLGDLTSTAANLGLSVDNLMQLIIKISISIVIGYIVLKKLWTSDAKAKQDMKEQLIKVFIVAFIAYFGIDLLQKGIDMIGSAIF